MIGTFPLAAGQDLGVEDPAVEQAHPGELERTESSWVYTEEYCTALPLVSLLLG